MDVCDNAEEIIKRCFTCKEHVISNLNIVKNRSNTTFIMWNRFQIFVYENFEFERASKIIVPCFQIHKLISSNNYIITMDCTGNIHTTSLKFKNTAQKNFKFNFLPRENSIVGCSLYSADHTICLKYESGGYFLSVHKINTEFTLEKRAILIGYDSLPHYKTGMCVIKTHPISEQHTEIVKKIFKIESLNFRKNFNIVIISFDKLNVYGCLYSTKMPDDEVNLVQLYSCPSEISSIKFIESELDNINIIIGLTIGTLIVLNLKDALAPAVLHLNTAIYKFSVCKNMILYTDGQTMWRAENLHTDKKFTQFFVTDVKDFVKFGDQIICTTFKNMIYTFSIDDERSYLKPISIEEYCSVATVLKNNDCMNQIKKEIIKSKKVIKLQSKEKDYFATLCLANRQDIMDQVIQQDVIVYGSYEEAISENDNVVLTNNYSEYYDTESFYFLIKITTTPDKDMSELFSDSVSDFRFHVILTSKSKLVKTFTVKMKCVLNKITLLMPLNYTLINAADMRVHTKICTILPGVRDPKQIVWAVIYDNNITLNSEHFVKLNSASNKSLCIKQSKESLENLILQTCMSLYGNLFHFTNTKDSTADLKKWHMYVRLPTEYETILTSENARKFTTKREQYFLQQMSSKDFLKSQSNLIVPIVKEKVTIRIENDGFSSPTLKISSYNVQNALHMRNFLSNLIYSVLEFQPGKEFISHSFYITVENLQKAVTELFNNGFEEDLLILIEQFEKKIIGSLPI